MALPSVVTSLSYLSRVSRTGKRTSQDTFDHDKGQNAGCSCNLVRKSLQKLGENCPMSGPRKTSGILSRLWLSWFLGLHKTKFRDFGFFLVGCCCGLCISNMFIAKANAKKKIWGNKFAFCANENKKKKNPMMFICNRFRVDGNFFFQTND